MSCNRLTTLFALSALAWTGGIACGRKVAPRPPIQIIPARTLDLVVQQRGSELLLGFSYPQTTVSGTALGGIQAVELWEYEQNLPVATFVAVPAEEETGTATEGSAEGVEDESLEGEAESPAAAGMETGSESGSGTEEAAAGEATGDDVAEGIEERVVTLKLIEDGAIALPEGMTRLEDLVVPDPAEFTASALQRLVLQGPELDSAVAGDRIRTRITLLELTQRHDFEVHAFAVKTVSNTGRTSAFSNLTWVVRRDPPEAPTEFEVQAQSDGVELRWTYAGRGPAPEVTPETQSGGDASQAPPTPGLMPGPAPGAIEIEDIVDDGGIEAFHVYRRSARSPSYDAPLRRVDKADRTFVDRTAAFGESYIYAVAAVKRNSPLIESTLSTEREVDYEDRFAPGPPRNLVTFAEPRSVRLLWDPSSSPDVAGYFIERRTGASEEWSALNTEPILGLEYTDPGVRSGQSYSYRVLAVDQKGLRGDPSVPTEVRVP
jgi:Fibronectin type III domain